MESKLVVFLCNAQRFEPLKMFCFIIAVRIIADASTKTTAVAMWPLSRATLSATCLSVCLSASSDAV